MDVQIGDWAVSINANSDRIVDAVRSAMSGTGGIDTAIALVAVAVPALVVVPAAVLVEAVADLGRARAGGAVLHAAHASLRGRAGPGAAGARHPVLVGGAVTVVVVPVARLVAGHHLAAAALGPPAVRAGLGGGPVRGCAPGPVSAR